MSIDLDEAKVERNAWKLGAAWTLATTLGLMIGYLPAALLVPDMDLGLARVIVPLLAGIIIGLTQWLVLRDYVTSSRDWIINHAGGWIVGYVIGLFIVQWLAKYALWGAVVGYLLFGVIIALFQWPILRREIPHIWSWILANALGWLAGVFLSQVITGTLLRGSQTGLVTRTLLSVGITGFVAGIITATALIWIVRQPELPVVPAHNTRGG